MKSNEQKLSKDENEKKNVSTPVERENIEVSREGQESVQSESDAREEAMEFENTISEDKLQSEIESDRIRTLARKKKNKALITGFAAFVAGIMIMTGYNIAAGTTTTITKTPETSQILSQGGFSTTLGIGAVLSTTDDATMQAQDYTIEHSSSEETGLLYIWDYAAEDGDFVQVLVNGVPVADPFFIKHKPTVFTIPATAEVKIVGVKDGGGGITYGAYYDFVGETYFNISAENQMNTYTFIKI